MLFAVSDLRLEQEDTQLLGLLAMETVLAVLASQKGEVLPDSAQPQQLPGQEMAPTWSIYVHAGPEARAVRSGVAAHIAANCSIAAEIVDICILLRIIVL